MCGIAGVVGKDLAAGAASGRSPSAWARDVEQMLAALRHRGPDGEALVEGGAAVLGAVRLAVIDVAGGAQPMSTEGDRHHLALNGEIVNHVELRARLESEGVRFRTRCDTEVLLHLLAREGVAGLAHVDGMFAGAFLDQTSGELLLFRDPCGIKPLYVLDDGDRVLFASEQKAFFAVAGIERRLHEPALLDYLAFQVPLDEATFFEGVRRIAPGTVMRLRPGRAPRVEALPDWSSPVAIPDERAAAAAVLRSLLIESVGRHVRADVPLGAHLSGGVDSSLIAALATRAVGAPLHAFTGGFSVRGFDERPHARAVAAELRAELHEFEPTPCDAADALPRAARAMDEPAGGPGLLPQWALSCLAAEHVKVVLGGQGGDELFGGYARYQVLALADALAGVGAGTGTRTGAGEPLAAGRLAAMAPQLGSLSGYAPLVSKIFSAGLDEAPLRRLFRITHRGDGLRPLATGDLARRIEGHDAFGRFEAAHARVATGAPPARTAIGDALRFDRAYVLPALLHVEDRTSMAWSLESRVPFLGRPVLSFVDRLPDAMLLPDGEPKGLLRQAVGADLPAAAAARRDKMGFPVPLARWAAGPLRGFFRELLLDGAARSRGLFDPVGVERLLGRDSVTARELWAIANVELWLRNDAA